VTRSLDEAKGQIASKFLGKAGIHSIGISRAENAIRVYLDATDKETLKAVWPEIEQEAAPYKVIAIQSDRSSIL
jgi:hypothetical protein